MITPLMCLDKIGKVNIYLKQDYLNHPNIQGNKYHKLKLNIQQAQKEGARALVTFGGAYSNHILATASAAQEYGFESIGIIRGDELSDKSKWSSTLHRCNELGMSFRFVSRQEYRLKEFSPLVNEMLSAQSSLYLIPEGGSNCLAVRGCRTISFDTYSQLPNIDYFMLACGTGGTISGVIDGFAKISASKLPRVIGVPVLKGASFLYDNIRCFSKYEKNISWGLLCDYHFGGYAKINDQLYNFSKEFDEKYQIPFDMVYTIKLFYAAFDYISKINRQKSTEDELNLVIYHSGGLQKVYE